MQNPGVLKKIICSICKEKVESSSIVEIGIKGHTCNKCYKQTFVYTPKDEILRIMRGGE